MEYWIIGFIIMFSHFVEGVSGFGCMILALPVVSMFMGMKEAVPFLVLLSTMFDLALVWKDKKSIIWRNVFIIVVVSGAFMPVGFYALRNFREDIMSSLLGCFMVLIAAGGLVSDYYSSLRRIKLPKGCMYAFLPIAGIVQGAFGGSGPFIILYAKQVLTQKTIFRGTMAMVWVVLNIINLVQYSLAGMVTVQVFISSLKMLPFLAGGFILGTTAHKHIGDRQFSRFIYSILLIAGLLMAI